MSSSYHVVHSTSTPAIAVKSSVSRLFRSLPSKQLIGHTAHNSFCSTRSTKDREGFRRNSAPYSLATALWPAARRDRRPQRCQFPPGSWSHKRAFGRACMGQPVLPENGVGYEKNWQEIVQDGRETPVSGRKTRTATRSLVVDVASHHWPDRMNDRLAAVVSQPLAYQDWNGTERRCPTHLETTASWRLSPLHNIDIVVVRAAVVRGGAQISGWGAFASLSGLRAVCHPPTNTNTGSVLGGRLLLRYPRNGP